MNEGDCPSVAATPGIQDYVTILGELWPGTGMERFYLGYIAGPEKWMKVFKTQKQVISICTNAQIQFAAIEAFPILRPTTDPGTVCLQKITEKHILH